MRFDPSDEKLFFSDIQELSPEEREQFINLDRAQKIALLKNAFSGQKPGGGLSAKSILSLIIVAAVIIAFIVTWKMDMPRLTIGLFGGIWLFFGIYLMTFGKNKQTYSADSSSLKPATSGMFILAIGVLVTGGAVLSKYFSLGNVAVTCGGLLFVVCGLLFFCTSLMEKLRSSALIGEQISGECIGYVRSVGSDSESHITYIVTSAVFRYYRDGVWMEAIDNYKAQGGGSPFAVGQTVDLTIDKKDPYFITSVAERTESKAGSFMSYVFPLIFVVVGVGLTLFGLTHEIKDNQLRSTNTFKGTITDQTIEEKAGSQDWTAEFITVTDKKLNEEDGFWYVYYGDDLYIYCNEDIAEQYTVGESYYFIRSAEDNHIFAVYSDKDWNYDASKDYKDLRPGKKSGNTF